MFEFCRMYCTVLCRQGSCRQAAGRFRQAVSEENKADGSGHNQGQNRPPKPYQKDMSVPPMTRAKSCWKLWNYIEKQELTVTGSSIETPIINISMTNNPKEFLTEIQIPIEAPQP